MKGPYTITVGHDGAPGTSATDEVKRLAIRTCRRLTKLHGEGAKGEVRDGDDQLVRQVEAYRTAAGSVKVRDLEI